MSQGVRWDRVVRVLLGLSQFMMLLLANELPQALRDGRNINFNTPIPPIDQMARVWRAITTR